MGFLKRLFGGAGDGWPPRPFYTNKSADDCFDWFAHVPPWNKVDRAVLGAYIDRLLGNQMFELFVHTSTQQNLVPRYAELERVAKLGLPYAVRAQTAALLSNSGAAHLQSFMTLMQRAQGQEEKLSATFGAAVDAFESAVHVEPEFTQAYGQLAAAKMLMGKREEAEEWCRRGLAVVAEQKKQPLPERPEMNLAATVREQEQKLLELLASIRS